jgi:hypothetical protein
VIEEIDSDMAIAKKAVMAGEKLVKSFLSERLKSPTEDERNLVRVAYLGVCVNLMAMIFHEISPRDRRVLMDEIMEEIRKNFI